MPKDSNDSVIQLTTENNQLRIWSEKNTSVGDWNERMTAEQTLEFLDYQEVFSYYALLKSCHTIAECKKSWSQKNIKAKKVIGIDLFNSQIIEETYQKRI